MSRSPGYELLKEMSKLPKESIVVLYLPMTVTPTVEIVTIDLDAGLLHGTRYPSDHGVCFRGSSIMGFLVKDEEQQTWQE